MESKSGPSFAISNFCFDKLSINVSLDLQLDTSVLFVFDTAGLHDSDNLNNVWFLCHVF